MYNTPIDNVLVSYRNKNTEGGFLVGGCQVRIAKTDLTVNKHKAYHNLLALKGAKQEQHLFCCQWDGKGCEH